MVGIGRRGAARPLSYLALGDSYTIGTGASTPAAAWPAIIARRLGADLANPAVNGFTTADLIREELPLLDRLRPRLVSLLIGANDIVQGFSAQRYAAALREIHGAIAAVQPASVLGVAIPDWSITPTAAAFGRPDQIRSRIDSFNQIARVEAEARGWLWADVVPASRAGSLSADRLHPDDAQYAAWAEVIWEVVAAPWSAAA